MGEADGATDNCFCVRIVGRQRGTNFQKRTRGQPCAVRRGGGGHRGLQQTPPKPVGGGREGGWGGESGCYKTVAATVGVGRIRLETVTVAGRCGVGGRRCTWFQRRPECVGGGGGGEEVVFTDRARRPPCVCLGRGNGCGPRVSGVKELVTGGGVRIPHFRSRRQQVVALAICSGRRDWLRQPEIKKKNFPLRENGT